MPPRQRANFKDLPPELFSELGRVVARWGQIEHLLAVIIKRTSDLDWEAAFKRVDEIGYSDKVRKRVRRYHNEWADAKFDSETAERRKASFSGHMKRVKDLGKVRGGVVHSAWHIAPSGELIAAYKGETLEDEAGKPFGLRQMQELGDQLLVLLGELNLTTEEVTKPDVPSVTLRSHGDLHIPDVYVTGIESIPDEVEVSATPTFGGPIIRGGGKPE